jgi:hypothetical protein
VIRDGQVEPIGLERVLGATQHGADIGGMFARRVKIGKVANAHRHLHGDARLRHEYLSAQLCIVAQEGLIVAKELADSGACLAPSFWAGSHEGLKIRFIITKPNAVVGLQEPRRGQGGETEREITYSHADFTLPPTRSAKHAKWKVLNRKMRLTVNGHPGFEVGIGGRIHAQFLL